MNYLYFMGITSSGADIGSIVLNQPANPSGDVIGLGNILYGTGPLGSPAPEASAVIPFTLSLLLGMLLRRRHT